ncbi:MAG: ABC transporter substrate-binding protein [Cyanobacteria bacterium CRU_2_1]|nr:ABC transporter substrate-binding protein [Cyanobacteria bacterium RU_5_0]NJR63455.1 ABC transporter substrate-binding protein [Cyanobacteria bacterium CRU_2_1]
MNKPCYSKKDFYGISRRRFMKYGSILLGSSLLLACSQNKQSPSDRFTSDSTNTNKLDKVTLGTEWVAQAEHGGFYQAIATGIYNDHGLEVTIKQGGPRANNNLLLMLGAVDFIIGYAADAINSVEAGIPKITVAAPFQKAPQVLIAHPNTGNDSLENLKGKPILISAAATVSYWPFLKAKYGFTDDQKRPYDFDPNPFLADKNLIQQGYLTSEPFEVERRGGFEPVVILLADNGYNPYTNTIETRTQLVETNPNLVQRFVDASIKGWYSYLENPTPGNQLIQKDNPDMTDEQIIYSIQKLKEYGIVVSGDAEIMGIGAMTDARWKEFFDSTVEVGVFKPGVNYKNAYTLKFINKSVDYYRA